MTPRPQITFNTVKELLSNFTTVSNIDAGYQSEYVILGPVIAVLVPDDEALDRLKKALRCRALPYTKDGNSINAGIPLVPLLEDKYNIVVFHDQRIDRLRGSGVISMAFAPPIRCLTNLQAFTFSVASDSTSPNDNDSTQILSEPVAELMQTTILFLVPMLLLSPDQARMLLQDLIKNGHTKWRMDRTGFRWTCEFGSEVPDCLNNFPDTFPSLDKLKEFQVNPLKLIDREEKDQYWTSVERRMKTENQYLIIAFTCHEHSVPPGTNGRSWRESILGVDVPGLRSAIALPRPVKEQHGGYLLAFADDPSGNSILVSIF